MSELDALCILMVLMVAAWTGQRGYLWQDRKPLVFRILCVTACVLGLVVSFIWLQTRGTIWAVRGAFVFFLVLEGAEVFKLVQKRRTRA